MCVLHGENDMVVIILGLGGYWLGCCTSLCRMLAYICLSWRSLRWWFFCFARCNRFLRGVNRNL